MAICGRCVNTLNAHPEVAEGAQRRIAEMLRRGIVRRTTEDLLSQEVWVRERASRRLNDMDQACADALPGWLNKLLADPANTSRDFKMMRAHRRHLLHFDRPKNWGYTENWKDVAARIRSLDGFMCTQCGASNQVLDVHHIVYVYHFGTHRQENLATLCRNCHEAEHGRALDFGENLNSNLPPPIPAMFPESLTFASGSDENLTLLPITPPPATHQDSSAQVDSASLPFVDPPTNSSPPPLPSPLPPSNHIVVNRGGEIGASTSVSFEKYPYSGKQGLLQLRCSVALALSQLLKRLFRRNG